jgi:outer membrane protein OmpA-like peptidoglycan-associated protein
MVGSDGWSAKEGSSGPYEFVFEFPNVASVQQLAFYAGRDPVTAAHTIHVAVSTQSATSGFQDIATDTLTDAPDEQDFALKPPVKARWLKLTVDARGASTQLYLARATGVFDPWTPSGRLQGTWLYSGDLFGAFGLATDAAGSLPTSFDAGRLNSRSQILQIRQTEDQVQAAICSRGNALGYAGNISGSVLDLKGAAPVQLSPGVVNTEGTMIVGWGSGQNWSAVRLRGDATCDTATQAQPKGTGQSVLVLVENSVNSYPPYQVPDKYPGYRFVLMPATLFDVQTLRDYQSVVLSSVCTAGSLMSRTQTQSLMDWVYAGHKLIVHDSDSCTASDYSFLPYAFTTSNPGAHAARGNTLLLVESNTLGSDASDPAHAVDVSAYVATTGQQLGDANVVTTHDPHWCGHLFGTNVLKQNGYVQMFAPFGQGMIIYDGLDQDDADIPQNQRISALELAQPAGAALSCAEHVADAFSVAPSELQSFTPGKAETARFHLAVLASHGFSGTVTLAAKNPASAPWKTSVSISSVTVNGDTAPFDVTIDVPPDARPGDYAFTVTGSGGGASASATITLSSLTRRAVMSRANAEPQTPHIARALQTAKRVAVYGIYFDFASATLRPESKPVLNEIAAALRSNPSWKLTIEGHTDNVGGATYNLDLSKRRAQSVMSALVARYHITADRLNAAGYGFSRPKASNDTAEGRALNRRVELVRR